MTDVKKVILETLKCQNVTYRDVLRAALGEIERLEGLQGKIADSTRRVESNRLNQLAEKLRDPAGHLSKDSLLCQQAAQYIYAQEQYVISLQSRLAKEHTQQRIATALEQAALYGWGSVGSEQLLKDYPAQPEAEDP